MSNQELGKVPRRPDPAVLRLWDGISMYQTESQARRKARLRPSLGRYLAAVELPEAGTIRVERTTGSEGHYTVCAEATVLLRQVRSVVPA
jgi:hypothetical protein